MNEPSDLVGESSSTIRVTRSPVTTACDDEHLQVHDLLKLRRVDNLRAAPAWVADALMRTPWVVVRRAHPSPGYVAVGVRGGERSQRLAMEVNADTIDRIVKPEDLRQVATGAGRTSHLAWKAMAGIASAMAPFDLTWGPTGSVGFELATAMATVSATSDLDLIVRCPEILPRERARELHRSLSLQAGASGCRIDILVEMRGGAMSLAEYARGGTVVLRTMDGPRLVDDPWHLS